MYVIKVINLSRISKNIRGHFSSKHYRLVSGIMAIINQFPTVSLFLASDTEHGTNIDGERDSRSKNISQLEQHAHC